VTPCNLRGMHIRLGKTYCLRGGAVALEAGRLRVRFLVVSIWIFIYLILSASLRPWGRLRLWCKWISGISPWK